MIDLLQTHRRCLDGGVGDTEIVIDCAPSPGLRVVSKAIGATRGAGRGSPGKNAGHSINRAIH
jgi:hypothetical protein